MKISKLRGDTNTIILIAVLLLNSLYESELGGKGSIFNTISFLLLLMFLLLNHRMKPLLFFLFLVPIIFLGLSVAVNYPTLHPGGYNAAIVISLGYMLLTLKPFPLDRMLMQRLIVAYLIGCVALSLYCTADNLAIRLIAGNTNFNLNQNAASLFFVGCLILSFEFVHSYWLWIIPIILTLLILTTGSRGGMIVGAMLWAGYIYLSSNQPHRTFFKSIFTKSKLASLAGFASIPFLALYLIPDAIKTLFNKFAVVGVELVSTQGVDGTQGSGRDVLWQSALNISMESMTSLFFGHGPSTASGLLEYGTHSSYVEAFTSVGWPFLIFSLVAIGFLLQYHIKHSQGKFLIFAVPILLYGAVETVLFNGLSNLWYIFIFLSLYYRSRDSG